MKNNIILTEFSKWKYLNDFLANQAYQERNHVKGCSLLTELIFLVLFQLVQQKKKKQIFSLNKILNVLEFSSCSKSNPFSNTKTFTKTKRALSLALSLQERNEKCFSSVRPYDARRGKFCTKTIRLALRMEGRNPLRCVVCHPEYAGKG